MYLQPNARSVNRIGTASEIFNISSSGIGSMDIPESTEDEMEFPF